MITLHSSSTETSSGVGTPVDLGETDRFLSMTVAVSAITGTLTTVIESAPSASGPWTACGEPSSETEPRSIAQGQWVRLRWVGAPSGATPFSATFAVTAEPSYTYADLTDLHTYGMPSVALRDVPTTTKAKALRAASMKADTKLGLAFDLPLISWGDDLRECVAKIAAYDLLSFKGFNPDGDDANVRTRHDDAWKLLGQVADLRAKLQNIVDSTEDVDDNGIVVVSRPARGWRAS